MKLRGLFCEGNSEKVSIGRVLLWIVTIFCCWFWGKGAYEGKAIEVPLSLLYSGAALLFYNLGTKMKELIHLFIQLKWGKSSETIIS